MNCGQRTAAVLPALPLPTPKPRFRQRLWPAAAAFTLALQAGAALALDFGPLVLRRDEQRSLVSQIVVSDRMPLDPADLRVRLAHPDAYRSLGLTYEPALAAVEVSLQAGADGRLTLLLKPMPSPADGKPLDIVLIAFQGTTFHSRRYRVDPRSLGTEFAATDPTVELQRAKAAIVATAPKPHETAPLAAANTAAAVAEPAQANAEANAGANANAPGRTEVVEAVQRWARAWAQREVDAYAAAYEPDFKGTAGAASHAAWFAQRRERILSKRKIEVEVSDLKIDLRGSQAEVRFTQRYRGDELRATNRKRLLLVQQGSAWLIREEGSL